MIILGLDSSAVAASCAICQNDKILAYAFVNVKITHSQTLMPLMESVLKAAGMTLDDIDAFAVSSGPGSFTGLRIGVSAVKGMAFALNKPVCGVSTLFALAHNLVGRDVIACAVMDARRDEVYNALFDISGGVITRLTPDRAIALDDLGAELESDERLCGKEIVLAGDGALLAESKLGARERLSIAPEIIRYQNAASVCFAADKSGFIAASELMPAYIRKPQAERERIERERVKT
ncbi:MAG: tRNA (adenosine(37)-N6)-threonylcarbamoyltransferase complex dimerization subunit type 1 TsaB [Oscillospiraceae bacterium]|nr:tRNA (adenosine(37)-N6)-threonylcarbamoyltransferase complex dimerization subunit type 1 TsaB [Oscillospiraceae bacterium]